jgi:hypothetical protein
VGIRDGRQSGGFRGPGAGLARASRFLGPPAGALTIDDMADAAERAHVPALVVGLPTLFESHRAHDSERPAASHNAAVDTAWKRRL